MKKNKRFKNERLPRGDKLPKILWREGLSKNILTRLRQEFGSTYGYSIADLFRKYKIKPLEKKRI
jgi:hypothetical protein